MLFTGTPNADFLSGSAENDTILGLEGNDIVNGGQGDDFLNGNQGNDVVRGGQGDDTVRGGQGNDQIFGDDGNDILYGDLGADTVNGGGGDDIFAMGRRSDVPGYASTGGISIADADVITDFGNGNDLIQLIGGTKYEDLNIFQGTGIYASSTIIQDQVTGDYLAVLSGINANSITGNHFIPNGNTSNHGVLSFTGANLTGNEGNSGTVNKVVATIQRTGGSIGNVGGQVLLEFGSTAGADDFTNNLPISVNFVNGETSKTIEIPIVGDTVFEPDETLNLRLVNPTGGATLGSQQTTSYTIVNDDMPPGAFSFTAANYNGFEGNTGTNNAIAAVIQRMGGSNGNVSVQVQHDGGTATASDFTNNLPITVNFADGETAKTVEIPIVGDINFESDETINLRLLNPTGGTTLGSQQTATYTILNDDPEPTLSINDVTLTEGNFGIQNLLFTVNLSQPRDQAVTVNYATANNTAVAGDDYTATNGTLTFNPGVTTQTIAVPIVGNLLSENNETFFMNLTNPTNATIADNQGIGAIANDDRFNIPDANPIGVSSDILLSGGLPVSNVTVTIDDLQHTYMYDLRGTLTHVPSGTTVTLFDDVGSSDDLNGNYSLNDAFTGNFDSFGTFIPGGNYFPNTGGVLSSPSLSAFNGLLADGTWRLTIVDQIGADVGSFASWSLNVS
jgi:subtilisin-like proprotein convertase family protein